MRWNEKGISIFDIVLLFVEVRYGVPLMTVENGFMERRTALALIYLVFISAGMKVKGVYG